MSDLPSHESRAKVRLEARVSHLGVAVRDRPMRTVLAHVLYVAVHALLELPVSADFRSLLVGKVSEGTALADAVPAFDLLQTPGV